MTRRLVRFPEWRGLRITVEWKPADLWIGCYYDVARHGPAPRIFAWWDAWICVIPCVPIHLHYVARRIRERTSELVAEIERTTR